MNDKHRKAVEGKRGGGLDTKKKKKEKENGLSNKEVRDRGERQNERG